MSNIFVDKAQQKADQFRRDLTRFFNQNGVDTLMEIPDYVLAEYVDACLNTLKEAVKRSYNLAAKQASVGISSPKKEEA